MVARSTGARAQRERGHTLTLFNRGVNAPDLFPEVEHLRGDRGGEILAAWHAAGA